jgi:hypothetical protein
LNETRIAESLIEEAALSWLASLDLHLRPEIAPAETAACYLGSLPKFISREIMINNVKNPSETKK